MCHCRKHEAGFISGSEMPGRHSPLGLLIYYVSGGPAPGGQLAEHRVRELAAASWAHTCHHTSGRDPPRGMPRQLLPRPLGPAAVRGSHWGQRHGCWLLASLACLFQQPVLRESGALIELGAIWDEGGHRWAETES